MKLLALTASRNGCPESVMKRREGAKTSLTVVLLLFCISIDSARAAPPTLDYLFPPALKRGATAAITAGGKLDPWPPSAWTDCPGLTFTAETNSGKFSVQVAEDAPLGP